MILKVRMNNGFKPSKIELTKTQRCLRLTKYGIKRMFTSTWKMISFSSGVFISLVGIFLKVLDEFFYIDNSYFIINALFDSNILFSVSNIKSIEYHQNRQTYFSNLFSFCGFCYSQESFFGKTVFWMVTNPAYCLCWHVILQPLP